MNPELSALLQYDCPSVIHHFCNHHPQYSEQDGRTLFKDLLAWMWLSQQRNKSDKKTYLFGPLLVLDEMWHSFILHTRDYVNFSNQFFGEYFHHEVELAGFEHQLSEDELTDFLQDCLKYLDEGWLERRFSEVMSNEH